MTFNPIWSSLCVFCSCLVIAWCLDLNLETNLSKKEYSNASNYEHYTILICLINIDTVYFIKKFPTISARDFL